MTDNLQVSANQIIEEMKKQNMKIAVYGLKYYDYDSFALELNDILFFKDYNDFLAWHDTLYQIFEPHERPINVFMIQAF